MKPVTSKPCIIFVFVYLLHIPSSSKNIPLALQMNFILYNFHLMLSFGEIVKHVHSHCSRTIFIVRYIFIISNTFILTCLYSNQPIFFAFEINHILRLQIQRIYLTAWQHLPIVLLGKSTVGIFKNVYWVLFEMAIFILQFSVLTYDTADSLLHYPCCIV